MDDKEENNKALGYKDTLVQYKMPDLICNHLPKHDKKFLGLANIPIAGAQDGDYVVPPTDKTGVTEEILDLIFPPRQWEENGRLWRQTVSSDPVTMEGIAQLSERLDKCLHEQEAKEDGIDVVRSKSFSQFFDEIIRIETIICGERGLLLGRIREDLKYTMAVHRKLYESCMAYAMRKSLQAEQKDKEEAQCLTELKEGNVSLLRQIAEVKEKTANLQYKMNEQREEDARRHAESLVSLREVNQQMKAQLRALLKVNKPSNKS